MPPCVIVTPLALAARHYWLAASEVRFGLALGAAAYARDALGRLVLQHDEAAGDCPIRARIGRRLPALVAELAPLSP